MLVNLEFDVESLLCFMFLLLLLAKHMFYQYLINIGLSSPEFYF